MKYLKKFNESKIESDKSFNKQDILKIVGDTFSTDGIIKQYHNDIISEIKSVINGMDDEDLKMMWYGYQLQQKGATETPEDFDVNVYSKVAKTLMTEL